MVHSSICLPELSMLLTAGVTIRENEKKHFTSLAVLPETGLDWPLGSSLGL